MILKTDSENICSLYVFNPFVTRKNQLSRIFAKIQPQNYRFSGISNPQRFLRYLFSFPRYWDNIGFNIFFNSAHI